MTILITGGAGYIGSHMVLNLMAHREKVVILDNLSTGQPFLLPANIPLIIGDIGDANLLSKIIQDYHVTEIMHFASSILIDQSVANPMAYYHNNTIKSHTLITTALQHNIKHLVFSSSASVYGVPETVPIKETTPLRPTSPYGSSKMMTELMLQDASKAHDFSYMALRYFNVAGADPQLRSGQAMPVATHLINVAAQAVTGERENVKIFGTNYPTPDGTGVRDYIHVSDLAEAHRLALNHIRNGGESNSLNCGYGCGFSVLQVLEAVKQVARRDFPVIHTERRPGDPPELTADTTKITNLLNWRPAYNNINTIIEHALKWEHKLTRMRHKKTKENKTKGQINLLSRA